MEDGEWHIRNAELRMWETDEMSTCGILTYIPGEMFHKGDKRCPNISWVMAITKG